MNNAAAILVAAWPIGAQRQMTVDIRRLRPLAQHRVHLRHNLIMMVVVLLMVVIKLLLLLLKLLWNLLRVLVAVLLLPRIKALAVDLELHPKAILLALRAATISLLLPLLLLRLEGVRLLLLAILLPPILLLLLLAVLLLLVALLLLLAYLGPRWVRHTARLCMSVGQPRLLLLLYLLLQGRHRRIDLLLRRWGRSVAHHCRGGGGTGATRRGREGRIQFGPDLRSVHGGGVGGVVGGVGGGVAAGRSVHALHSPEEKKNCVIKKA